MSPQVGQLIRAYSADGASLLTPEELAAVPGPRRWLTGFYFSLVTVSALLAWSADALGSASAFRPPWRALYALACGRPRPGPRTRALEGE